MVNLENYLSKDEKVIWFRCEIVNIVYFIRLVIIFIVLSFIVIPLFNFIYDSIGEMEILSLIVFFFISDVVLLFLAGYNYSKRKKKLNLTYNQLKNYEEFVILTNKRFIRKNYYMNYKLDLSRYVFENILEYNDDIIFIKLENIKAISIDYLYREIYFLFEKDSHLSKFYIKFLKKDLKEINEVLKRLKQILNLKKVEKDPHYEKFI